MTARSHAIATLARVSGPPDVIEATTRPRAGSHRSRPVPEVEGANDRGGKQFLIRSLREMR